MNSFKIWFIAALAAITALSSYLLFNRGVSIGARHDAIASLHTQTKTVNDENSKIYKDNEKLSKKIDDTKKEYNDILENDEEFAKYNKKVQDLEKSIAKIKQEISDLGNTTDTNSKYANEISKISNSPKGSPVTYNNSTLKCPGDISEGRYKIEGNGSFRIIKISNNNITESQNVKNLESNSYTCKIDSDSKIIIEGTLKFTEVD